MIIFQTWYQVVFSIYLKTIVELDIAKIINKFNQNKSVGHENIRNHKQVKTEILNPLTQILNLSLSSGVVPENLKVASKGYTCLQKGCLILKLSSSVTFTMLL